MRVEIYAIKKQYVNCFSQLDSFASYENMDLHDLYDIYFDAEAVAAYMDSIEVEDKNGFIYEIPVDILSYGRIVII